MTATTSARFDQRSLADKLASAPVIAPLAAVLIGAAGVAALFSVAGGSMEPYAIRHVARLVAGFAVVIVIAVLPLRFWLGLAYPAYVLLLAALAAVPFFGNEALGAQRWLALGPLSFQPAEPMKVALVLALARFLQGVPANAMSHWAHVATALLMILVPAAFILAQPDLGTAILVAAIGLTVLFCAGTNFWYFAAGAGGAAAVVPLLWDYLHDYQQRRVLVFLDPEVDPLGMGYQITQAKIALGAGGLTGKGLLQGTQSQLDFVPEKHTDFIFALIAEETGFIGGAILICLFGVLLLSLIGMGLRCRSLFCRLVCVGVATTLFLHVTVNLGMVMGALPVVGVPLPLVSYGGTSLLATLAGLGLAMNAFVHRRQRLRAGELGLLLR